MRAHFFSGRLALVCVMMALLPLAWPRTNASTGAPDPILVGAGDIAACGDPDDAATAALLDALFAGDPPGAVFTTGDNVYNDGTPVEFANCYAPSWGQHKSRTYPSPGNHDYHTAGAAGYFGYFGAAAGDPTKGYYSYDLGDWHIIVLNSSNGCGVIGCNFGSAQEQWLRSDLAANPAACTLAYWHHPRFSSGQHGSDTDLFAFWQALYDYGVDVVVNGHDHNYERFAPQDPAGNLEPERGIREFVVGTGGRSLRSFGVVEPNSEVRDSTSYGVLKLTLHATSYDWEFVPAPPGTFTDSGSQDCLMTAADTDTDGDGCTDLDETRTAKGSEIIGGRRDKTNFWDFFDTPHTLGVRDGAVSAPDFFAVLNRFGATGNANIDPLSPAPPPPAYHPAFDRGPQTGPDPWDLSAADGAIASSDFFAILDQFGHTCG